MKTPRTGEVEISDVDPATLKQLLEYIYTGQVVIFRHFLILDCDKFHPFSHFLPHSRLKMEPSQQSFSTQQTNTRFADW